MIIIEGAVDIPAEVLKGRTPLQIMRGTYAALAAQTGQTGMIRIPEACRRDRLEVMLAALMGFPRDRAEAVHRGPLEAIGRGIDTACYSAAFLGSFITMDSGIIKDAAPVLNHRETASLVEALQRCWAPESLKLIPIREGLVLVLTNTEVLFSGWRPCLLLGEEPDDLFQTEHATEFLRSVFDLSQTSCRHHAVNEVRIDLGENPADALWLWGGGPVLDKPFDAQPGLLMTWNNMARGLANLLSWESTPLLSPYVQEHSSAFSLPTLIEGLRRYDRVTVYVPAPHGACWYGDVLEKVKALDQVDRMVTGPLLDVVKAFKPYRMVVTTDGMASCNLRDHLPESVPFVVTGEGLLPDQVDHWDETACAAGALGLMEPEQFVDFIDKDN